MLHSDVVVSAVASEEEGSWVKSPPLPFYACARCRVLHLVSKKIEIFINIRKNVEILHSPTMSLMSEYGLN